MLTFIIFAILFALMFFGVPVAVCMGLTAVFLLVAKGQGFVLPMVAQRMYASTTGFTLLAIPFFILAGNLMNTGGITRRLFRLASVIVGPVRGGLGHANIIASMIFSGMSGAAVADAAGLGQIEISAMDDAGYDRKFSAAITAASSTIGPIIPPSIPFVIYGSLTGLSVGKLFLAGFTPGIAMGIGMMIAVYFVARHRNYPKEQAPTFQEVLISVKEAILPMMTPVIIIGGILSGFFTPTEASVVATLYALVLGLFVYREYALKDLPNILWEALEHTIRIMFIISASGFFGWFMIHQRVPEQVIRGLSALASSDWSLLLIIIVILTILGCFLEGITIFLITVPVFMPLIQQYGIDPLHFGVIITLCTMVALLTPPVGMSLYAVVSISGVPMGSLSKEIWPYLAAVFAVILLVTFFPGFCLWLPNLLMGR
ncbi:MAG: TRAP transporter large permease [Candidatus Vecturithrix sp.]|jgi:tripartite ATP-independent transporter DctM subunit|nr:TRAP transporter large permease [Candidatus Vecturithrix sp.]